MSESDRQEQIRRRAYERYEARGGSEGSDVEDWIAAEEELFHSTGTAQPEKKQSEGAKSDEEKIDEAVEESFPASDAPSWRGGTSAA